MSTLRTDTLQTTDSSYTINVEDLASVSSLTTTVDNVTKLLLVDSNKYTSVMTLGYYSRGDGGGAEYFFDPTDTTSTTNGYVQVGLNGARWKLSKANRLNSRQFGTTGNGTTDDSIAWNRATAYAIANHETMEFLPGKYILSSPDTLTNRCFLKANQDVTFVGAIKFDAVFPRSADTATPVTDLAPFFSVDGINFQSVGSAWGLDVKAQYGSDFIDTATLMNSRFYGQYGLRAKNLITASLSNCWFYNTLTGAQAEGCTNWSVDKCLFRNQAVVGFRATVNQDDPGRKGGENIRFSQCEFDVCTQGVHLFRHQWGAFSNCLFDYCRLGLNVEGSAYTKMVQCYAGSADISSLVSIPGYEAAPTLGIAVYVHPYLGSPGPETAGLTATDCEFVNYVSGSTQPVVYVDGFWATQPGNKYAERVSFSQCKFIQAASHNSTNMLTVSYTTNVLLTDNMFISPNLSTTLTTPFNLNNVSYHNVKGTDTTLCLQSSVEVKSTFENTSISKIRMARDVDGFEVQTVGGSTVMKLLATGSDRLQVYTGGALNQVGVGAANSGGAGFRNLIIPN